MPTYTNSVELAVKGYSRDPVWTVQTSADAAPGLPTDGLPLNRAVRSFVHVATREISSGRSARLAFTNYVAGSYTLGVGTETLVYDSTGEDLNTFLNNYATAWNADGDVSPLATAVALGADGSPSTTDAVELRITTVDFPDLAFPDPVVPGGAVGTLTADAIACDAIVWWYMEARAGGSPPTPWVAPDGTVQVTQRGYVARFDTGGIARVHVEVPPASRTKLGGDGGAVVVRPPTVSIGPALEN